jgi:hypothetical protein
MEDEMDWPMLRTVERRASRMSDMMERLDVDASKLVRLRAGEAFAEARTKCLQCSRACKCILWLDADPPSDEAPHFCPNFEVFETCTKSG